MLNKLEEAVSSIKEAGLFRQRKVKNAGSSVRPEVGGKTYLAFNSNDYLGLADDPRLVKALHKAADQWGVGSGSAHLVAGHTSEHHKFEEELAQFLGREKVLLFSTGYMANLGVISALCDRKHHIFQDKLNHASLIDGAQLSGGKLVRYRHADAGHLKTLLQKYSGQPSVIITDGVFSMDGDYAPLKEISAMAQDFSVPLVVDDAHGIGVVGRKGRGVIELFDLDQSDVPVLVGTLGKAFGTFGAFVAGSEELITWLVQKARTFIYTTAMPPAVAAASRKSLEIIQTESWRREKLTALISRFQIGAMQHGLKIMTSQTPIQPLLIGEADEAMRVSEKLFEKGILITAIRPPTVPAGSSRLRIALSALHSAEDVDRLLEALSECC